jgi:hypothetical protein
MSELELDEAPTDGGITDPTRRDQTKGCDVVRPGTPAPTVCMDVPIAGVRTGTLVGMTDEGRIPLVIFPGQRGSSAVTARAVLDLHGDHIGREVVLMFEDGDPGQPIILGCLPPSHGWLVAERPGQVEVDADGERLVVSAKEQLVLRCGRASLTLTKEGKVLIQGAYVSSRSSGVNRIKGGSVQLN